MNWPTPFAPFCCCLPWSLYNVGFPLWWVSAQAVQKNLKWWLDPPLIYSLGKFEPHALLCWHLQCMFSFPLWKFPSTPIYWCLGLLDRSLVPSFSRDGMHPTVASSACVAIISGEWTVVPMHFGKKESGDGVILVQEITCAKLWSCICGQLCSWNNTFLIFIMNTKFQSVNVSKPHNIYY